MIRRLTAAVLTVGLLAEASAAEPLPAGPPTVRLTAEASVGAANDLAIAHAYVEASGPSPAELATRINRTIADALETAKGQPEVAVRSAGNHSNPIYGSVRSAAGRAQIEGWRMRATLELESTDVAALSALLGRLQATMAVADISLSPSPATRRRAEDRALVEALKNFEARAALAASTLGRKYRIRELDLNAGSHRPPVPMMRASLASAEAAPTPLAAGEGSVTVTVSGTVELID
ncbi:MAG: SIMPL domain-containing protein [Rhodocyclaceae bacterium]|nr:SIMPL domain-containing protein [Rhodocyclaceae bacterium]